MFSCLSSFDPILLTYRSEYILVIAYLLQGTLSYYFLAHV